jgi:hypothetical protein
MVFWGFLRVFCGHWHMLELREMKVLILRRDRLLWAIWCNNAQPVARDLLPVAKQRMLDEWQKNWEVTETGRFSHSIFPRVFLRPWFEECMTERKLITTVSRIISGHCGVRAHLTRFCIVDGSICVCLEDRETVDHIIWKFSRFSFQRACLIQRLLLSGVCEETPIRDLYAQLN